MKKTVRDVEVRGKTVIVRCDFNVPLDENKNITDDIRITSAMPTINYLVENDAKVILITECMLREFEDVFLDDMPLEEVEKEIGVPIVKVGRSGEDLLNALMHG